MTAGCASAAGSQQQLRSTVQARPTPAATPSPRSATAVAPSTPPSAPQSSHRHDRLIPSGGAAEPLAVTVGRPGHRILTAPVDPIAASVGSGIDPPVWGRAVFWTGSHQPASPSQGTTLVYAHACIHHVCPFTELHRAHLGAPVFLRSAKGRFRYRIVRIVSLPKVNLSTFGFSGYDLALITCELPDEGSEWDNRMVLGVLTGFRPARP